MGFATALSGLKAASTNLQVTGNNIANSQTTGFKQSRAEFADVYASSLGGVSKTQAGAGVRVTEVAQQFNDGNIEGTQNSLDLAISGNGFFVLADKVNLPDPLDKTAPVDPSVPSAYTRNGAFQLNSAGNVVNDKGQYLLAFAPNGTTEAEGFSVGVFNPLTIDTSQGLPSATSSINLKLNINAGAPVPSVSEFSPTDPKSYNNTTSATTYDSQGNPHIAATYYVKTPVANVWNAYLFIDNFGITTGGQAVPPAVAPNSTVSSTINTPGLPIPMSFNSSGLLEEMGVRASAVVSGAIEATADASVAQASAAVTAADLAASANLDADGVTAAQTAADDAATTAATSAATAATAAATAATDAANAAAAPDDAVLAATAAASASAAVDAQATADADAATAAAAAVKLAAASSDGSTYYAAARIQAANASAAAAALVASVATVTSSDSPSVLTLQSAAKAAADVAASKAADYVVKAALVVDPSTAGTALTAAQDAEAAAQEAQAAAVAYNNAVAATVGTATQTTRVDFGDINLTAIDPNIKVDPMAFYIDFAGTTQFTNPYSVNGSTQNGLPAGNLTGIDVTDTGVVFAKYSNGGSKALGQVALARFPSNQALSKLGDTTWGKTANSGAPIYGAAGDNNFGGIQSSALEGSNVDLSDQLVKLIIAQQAYQANSQTITTEKTLVDTILRA